MLLRGNLLEHGLDQCSALRFGEVALADDRWCLQDARKATLALDASGGFLGFSLSGTRHNEYYTLDRCEVENPFGFGEG